MMKTQNLTKKNLKILYVFTVLSAFIFLGWMFPANSSADGSPYQIIDFVADPVYPESWGTVSVTMTYDVSDQNYELIGIGVSVCYSDAQLTFEDATILFTDDYSGLPVSTEADSTDEDGDPDTNRVIKLAWTNILANDWPGNNQTYPLPLAELNFTINTPSAKINSAITSTPAGYEQDQYTGPGNGDIVITTSTASLENAIIALRVLSGYTINGLDLLSRDVDGDGKIGLSDAIVTMEKIADLRD